MSASGAQPAGPVLGVGAVIVLGSDEVQGEPGVVLVRRARPPNAGRWSLPGGRVERGETLVAATAREVLEETGLSVRVGPLIEVVEIVDDAHHYVVLDYLCRAEGGRLQAGDDAAEVAVASLGPAASGATRIPALDDFGVSELARRVVDKAVALLHAGVSW